MWGNITLQVGVKVLLRNQEGKFLLLRRSSMKYPEVDGLWDIAGGRIDPGRSLLENLKREVREETNLELIGEPKLIAAQDILRNANRHIVRLTYTCEARGEVKLDTEENDAYRWYELEELEKLNDVDVYFRELLNDKSMLVSQ